MTTAKLAKILPIPKTADPNKKSTANSLLQKGYNRQPGAKLTIMPVRLADGRYLTNLDEKAPHVLAIPSLSDRTIEQELIIERRKRLEDATGLDLGPKSFFYSKMSQADPQSGIYTDDVRGVSTKVATRVQLQDGENVFNFTDPLQEITFLWVALHPNVAPSLEDYKNGKVSPSVQFYVLDLEKEQNIIYKEKQEIAKSVITLSNGSLEQRKKWAKLIGLLVSENDSEQTVFNQLDDFIKSGEVKSGEFKGYRALSLFNQITSLKDNMLNTKALIRDAVTLGVYKLKNKALWEGDMEIALDQDTLLKRLLSNNGQEEYLALEEKINNKRGIVPNK